MMDESDESLLQRLRASVQRAQQTPERSTSPKPLHEVTVRDSVRQLSRSRVAQVLLQLRASRQLSYEQVREKTGLPQQLLFDVEYKNRRLTLSELAALAECYDVSVNDILGIDLEP